MAGVQGDKRLRARRVSEEFNNTGRVGFDWNEKDPLHVMFADPFHLLPRHQKQNWENKERDVLKFLFSSVFLSPPHQSISYHQHCRCPWCNCYRRRKWTRRHEFKSWTRLIAFHIALIPLGKVWIRLFSLQLWVNSRTDCVLPPWWGN